MSDGYGGAPPNGKKAKMGSVRAARERLEAGIQDTPQQAGSSQWPLERQRQEPPKTQGNVGAPNNINRGPPPQRPPRPSYVPSILDSSKMKEQMSVIGYEQAQEPRAGGPVQQQARYWEPNYAISPHAPSTPGTGISSSSSRDSTGSSVGSIPEFPVPALPTNTPPPLQFRRNGNLGPPPSSRRGASSYYSQSSYVAPIPEEAWEPASPDHRDLPRRRRDHSEWNEENHDYYGTRLDEDELDSRDSRSTDPDESTGLVRKASLGKQYKPSLTTVRSSRDTSSTRQGTDGGRYGTESIPVMLDDDTSPTFLRGPSEESEEQMEVPIDEKEDPDPEPHSRSDRSVDPQVEMIMGGLEKGGVIRTGTLPPQITSIEDSPPLRRPSPLDIDGTKRGEVRGSLSSLTDLIRRATRVAANLEKGRTASQLGMLDMFNSSNPNLLNKGAKDSPRRTSVTDMLASFPAPALGTPTPRSPRPDSRSRWPSPFVNSNGNHAQSPMPDVHKRPRGRRCCGMPLWLFFLLLVILLILIAAAVVIPIVLIVLPRQNQPSAPANPLSNCAGTNPCSNGGSSVISADSCRCICAGGFTGSNCTTQSSSSSGCTTTDVDSFKGATLGTSIPRLFSGASSNLSVPLNTTALLSDFSFNNMLCSDENNLVSFTNVQQKRDLPHAVQEYVAPIPEMTLVPRVADPEPQDPAATTNGIIFNGPTPTSTAPNLATTAGPTPTATSTSSGNGPNSTQADFAGIAMLYILQQVSLNTSVSAKNNLQSAFDSRLFEGPVPVASGITVDVSLFRVAINGTTVGMGDLSSD